MKPGSVAVHKTGPTLLTNIKAVKPYPRPIRPPETPVASDFSCPGDGAFDDNL
jgi:hypothetical protein